MRLKTVPRGVGQGLLGVDPDRAKVFLVLVSRGDEGPLNSAHRPAILPPPPPTTSSET